MCPGLNADLKKQIEVDYANICHTLGAQLYYEVDPVKARYYLEKALNLNPITITKVELAYLMLINLAKSSTQQDKKWAKNILDEIAQNPNDLEEFAIVFKNLALTYYSGNTRWELAKDSDKADYYWKILADAQFKEQVAISFHKEACNYHGMFLARNTYLFGQNQQEHINNKTGDHLTTADMPESYFKKIIALGDVHGYLGLGLCHFWKGIYDQADLCFSKIITGLSPQPLEINEAHEVDLDRINQAIAFWCKGAIIFTKKINTSDYKLGITLMEMAFQKLPILTSSELFVRHLPVDILQEVCMAADHAVSSQSNSNLDITLIYLIGRIYGALPNCQMHGMNYISHAAGRDHNWALLYLGCCQNFDKEDANTKANYLLKIKKNNENDLCYIQAQYYLQKIAQWGILNALLGLAQTKLTEGKLHEWLSELKPDEFVYDFLFNNVTENLHPKEQMSKELYTTLMNDESICGRMIKSMILISDSSLNEVKQGIAVGEKILPDLRKAHKKGYEVWKKFLEGLPLLESFVRTTKDVQITLEEFKKIYLVAKGGNNVVRIGVAVNILMDKVAAHDVRACIKEIGKKVIVKDYARKMLNDTLSLDKTSSFGLFERMITGLLLNGLANYLFKHGDKKEAETYLAISSKFSVKYAKTMRNSEQDIKKSDSPKLIRISASNDKVDKVSTAGQKEELVSFKENDVSTMALRYRTALSLIEKKEDVLGCEMLNKLAGENYFDAVVVVLLKVLDGSFTIQLPDNTLIDYFMVAAFAYVTIQINAIAMEKGPIDNFKRLYSYLMIGESGRLGPEKQRIAKLLLSKAQEKNCELHKYLFGEKKEAGEHSEKVGEV